ncbi:MAG: acetyl-CoA carboxylase biotin carboxyl carrier protein [Bacteroidia bacterium]
MDLKDIQALIKFISSSGVDEVSIERKDFKLNIRKNNKTTELFMASQQPIYQQAPAASRVENAPAAEAPKPLAEPVPNVKLIEVKSPMIGTFYRSAGPDKPQFINVGDEVNPGDTLCIIEAMKLFNEIECEIKGKIVKILADDSTPVEYDQPLFLVDPS